MRELIDAGADVMKRTSSGSSAKELAEQIGAQAVLDMLETMQSNFTSS